MHYLPILFLIISVSLSCHEKEITKAPVDSIDIGAGHARTGQMYVVFINPGNENSENPTGDFWHLVSDFMEAAAQDLNIDPGICL